MRLSPVALPLLCLLAFASCSGAPVSPPAQTANPENTIRTPLQKPSGNFSTQAVEAPEPPSETLLTLPQGPVNPLFNLNFQADAAADVQIPTSGLFQLVLEAGPTFQIIDADARDGTARIQVPSGVMDLYLHPEVSSNSASPPICQEMSRPTDAALLNQLDQQVLDKANALIAEGQGHCAYLPPLNQRQNANCNSTSTGLQCSGPVNKTIQASQCPEIAVYGGAMNLNHSLSSQLFVATQNNLTLNQSAQGLLVTRGDLNTSFNSSQVLQGVVVGARSNNLNLGGNSRFEGLYMILNNGSLSLNANQNAVFEGAMCSTGSVNRNRNGNSRLVYRPDVLNAWTGMLPSLPGLICDARPNFYTETHPKTCEVVNPTGSVTVQDTLFALEATLAMQDNAPWSVLPRRALPVPADWQSADGENYVLRFTSTPGSGFRLQAVSAAAPGRTPAAVKVIPAVDCVRPESTGGYLAYLSYRNLLSGAVTLPTGEANLLTPAELQEQPTRFEAGASAVYPASPHVVRFAGPQLTWTVGARSVTVEASDPAIQCPAVDEQRSPELLISNVWLTDSGESILGKEAPAALLPDYAGSQLEITIEGTFKNAEQEALSLNAFLFTLAPPLVQQTFLGEVPQARVLLDHSVLLDVLSVSETEIRARLNTAYLPDLYLKGLHRLSVEQGDWYTDALIRVGEPVETASLVPQIDTLEVVRNDAGQPLHLRITGSHFMVYPKFSHATVDGEFGFGYATEVTEEGLFETLIHVPDPTTFDSRTQHTLVYTTPFGAAFKNF